VAYGEMKVTTGYRKGRKGQMCVWYKLEEGGERDGARKGRKERRQEGREEGREGRKKEREE
jgi:hypothetical protein